MIVTSDHQQTVTNTCQENTMLSLETLRDRQGLIVILVLVWHIGLW